MCIARDSLGESMNPWNYALASVLMMLGVADAQAQVRVKGYTRKDGTYVAPHYRSTPNSSRYDNYSTKGNYNPYTGKKGYVDPYGQTYSPSSYSPPATYYAHQRRLHRHMRHRPRQEPRAHSGTAPAHRPICSARQYTADQGAEAVRALAQRLQASDPYWDIRYPQLSSHLASIGKVYPPSQWAEEAERAYWSIPASKSSHRPTDARTACAIQLAQQLRMR